MLRFSEVPVTLNKTFDAKHSYAPVWDLKGGCQKRLHNPRLTSTLKASKEKTEEVRNGRFSGEKYWRAEAPLTPVGHKT